MHLLIFNLKFWIIRTLLFHEEKGSWACASKWSDLFGIDLNLADIELVYFLTIVAQVFHVVYWVAQSVELEIAVDVLNFEDCEAATTL